MIKRIEIAGLQIDEKLAAFVADEAAPGTPIAAEAFWGACADILAKHAPTNRDLLQKRGHLQAAINDWHKSRQGQPHDPGGL